MRVRRDELVSALDITQLSDHEWRVSDSRKPECDGMSVIGFIERVGDSFEVFPLGNPGARSRHSSLGLCVSQLEHRSGDTDR